MNRRDWLLLALHYAGPLGLSPVQLQKSLFLLGVELPTEVGDFYEFVPHNYGPFAQQAYQDADALAAQGFVAIDRTSGPYAHFFITAAGEDRLRQVEQHASQRARDYLAAAVRWTQQQSFYALVRSIYEKYPQYRVNSVFRY